MVDKKQFFKILMLFIVISLFFRIDFRFKTSVECCSDDYDYYAHAETIALDQDFDYSNQLPDLHPFTYENEGKRSPVGFPGAGIMASPFLFIGNYLDVNFNLNTGSEVLNYKLLLYSMSPIFYFFLSFIIQFKSLVRLEFDVNKYKLLMLISGSGISYFAFERFSMTHVYEMFIISLLIWALIGFYKYNNSLSGFLIPPILMFSFLIRMSNFYVFIIPLIIRSIIKEKFHKSNNLLNNYYFILSSVATFLSYNFISNEIYGKLIINPQEVYGTDVTVGSVLSGSIGNLITQSLSDFFLILFGNEFGIFWVSPIIFSGFILLLFDFKNINKLSTFLLIICFAQNFAIILIWRSTAASYGFRYLYSLVPLAVLIFYEYKSSSNSKYFDLVFYMSIFSNLSILFFETTEQTQLSTVEIENSFGIIRNYSEPEYVTGIFKSFFELNSLLIIFTTSLIGVIFFKLLLLIFEISLILEKLSQLGLPTKNEDFLLYLDNLSLISINKLVLIILPIFLFCVYVVTILKNTSYRSKDI